MGELINLVEYQVRIQARKVALEVMNNMPNSGPAADSIVDTCCQQYKVERAFVLRLVDEELFKFRNHNIGKY